MVPLHSKKTHNMLTRVFHRPIFLEKKIRGTKQTANNLYIFHSSPKHLPKVRSRGLDHSDKCFFIIRTATRDFGFTPFLNKNVPKMPYFT